MSTCVFQSDRPIVGLSNYRAERPGVDGTCEDCKKVFSLLTLSVNDGKRCTRCYDAYRYKRGGVYPLQSTISSVSIANQHGFYVEGKDVTNTEIKCNENENENDLDSESDEKSDTDIRNVEVVRNPFKVYINDRSQCIETDSVVEVWYEYNEDQTGYAIVTAIYGPESAIELKIRWLWTPSDLFKFKHISSNGAFGIDTQSTTISIYTIRRVAQLSDVFKIGIDQCLYRIDTSSTHKSDACFFYSPKDRTTSNKRTRIHIDSDEYDATESIDQKGESDNSDYRSIALFHTDSDCFLMIAWIKIFAMSKASDDERKRHIMSLIHATTNCCAHHCVESLKKALSEF